MEKSGSFAKAFSSVHERLLFKAPVEIQKAWVSAHHSESKCDWKGQRGHHCE